jgi:hypothetical protein
MEKTKMAQSTDGFGKQRQESPAPSDGHWRTQQLKREAHLRKMVTHFQLKDGIQAYGRRTFDDPGSNQSTMYVVIERTLSEPFCPKDDQYIEIKASEVTLLCEALAQIAGTLREEERTFGNE